MGGHKSVLILTYVSYYSSKLVILYLIAIRPHELILADLISHPSDKPFLVQCFFISLPFVRLLIISR